METISQARAFGGVQGVYRHDSEMTGCSMEFAVFIPHQAADGPVPVLTYLSGLTCSWENVTVKAGAQRFAAREGMLFVAPDTSPRGFDFPGEHESYDFGSGAGFYVDATEQPWAENYRMYSYVTEELPALIAANFPADGARQGIFGHSMGGSVWRRAPIPTPTRTPWRRSAAIASSPTARSRRTATSGGRG